MAVADAAELEAAFAETFSAESEFGGAPDAEALFDVIKTPAGRAAGAVALRGKHGWIYLVPASSGTQTASTYRLSAASAKKADAMPTDPRDPHPPDEARIRSAVENMVPWGSPRTKKKSFKLQQVAPGGGTLGPTVDNHAFNRKVANSIVPGPASQLPQDPWTYDPNTNKTTLPAVNGPGVNISELRGCPTVSEGMINDFARVGGLITVLYAGIPNIFGCDLYAGFTALRWFSGEVVPMQPSFYTLCTGAVQTYPFNSGVINTRVQCTFTIPSRDPAALPGYVDALTPPEKKDFFCPPGPDSHFPGSGFNVTPTLPAGRPIVWERDGAPPIVADEPPDNGLRNTGTPTPDPTQPPSSVPSTSPTPGASTPPSSGPSNAPSPGGSTSPSPSVSPSLSPATLVVGYQDGSTAFSPNADNVKDELPFSIAASSALGEWTLSIDGIGEVTRGVGSHQDTLKGVVNDAVLPDGRYRLRLGAANMQDQAVEIVVDNANPIIPLTKLEPVAGDITGRLYTCTAKLADNLSGVDEKTIKATVPGIVSDIDFDSSLNTLSFTATFESFRAYRLQAVSGETSLLNIEVLDRAGNRTNVSYDIPLSVLQAIVRDGGRFAFHPNVDADREAYEARNNPAFRKATIYGAVAIVGGATFALESAVAARGFAWLVQQVGYYRAAQVASGVNSVASALNEANLASGPWRQVNPQHPPNSHLVNQMDQLSVCDDWVDCSEIAEKLYRLSGEKGWILKAIHPSGNLNTIYVMESNQAGGFKTVQYVYHEVYTDGMYVYDPRLSTVPIPKGDWEKLMRNMNDQIGIFKKKNPYGTN